MPCKQSVLDNKASKLIVFFFFNSPLICHIKLFPWLYDNFAETVMVARVVTWFNTYILTVLRFAKWKQRNVRIIVDSLCNVEMNEYMAQNQPRRRAFHVRPTWTLSFWCQYRADNCSFSIFTKYRDKLYVCYWQQIKNKK